MGGTMPSANPRLSRRRLLQSTALAALAAACSPLRPDSVSREGRGLRMLNWPDYIDPTEEGAVGTVDRLQEQQGLTVDYLDGWEDNFSGFDTYLAPTLGEGDPTGFDIIVPTYWLAERMLGNGWLEQIPVELIPNRVNLDPSFLGLPWDRGARFHLPWQVGLTGIAYDPALTGRELGSVADLFTPELRGRVSFIGEMREAVGLAMLALGLDPARADADSGSVAMDLIEQQAANVRAFTFNEFTDLLSSGEVAAAMAWSGDTVQLQNDRPDIQFVVPEEGAIRWFDTMVSPRGASNRGDAAAFMDFVYDPVQAAQLTAWVQYITPVLGVRDELVRQGNGELAENPILFPDQQTQGRLFTWTWRGTVEEEDALEARFFEVAGL